MQSGIARHLFDLGARMRRANAGHRVEVHDRRSGECMRTHPRHAQSQSRSIKVGHADRHAGRLAHRGEQLHDLGPIHVMQEQAADHHITARGKRFAKHVHASQRATHRACARGRACIGKRLRAAIAQHPLQSNALAACTRVQRHGQVTRARGHIQHAKGAIRRARQISKPRPQDGVAATDPIEPSQPTQCRIMCRRIQIFRIHQLGNPAAMQRHDMPWVARSTITLRDPGSWGAPPSASSPPACPSSCGPGCR